MWNNSLIRFILFYLLYSCGAAFVLYPLFLQSGIHGSDYVLPASVYFFLVTLVFHAGLLHFAAGRPAVFVRYYMGATTLKLFLHLGILVFYALYRSEQLVPFATVFLVLYLCHTAYESVAAFRQMRKPA